MTERRLFGLPLIATGEIYAERTSELNIEWRSVAYGVSAALTAAATKHLLLGMGSRLERRSLLLEDGGESPEDKGPRTSFVLTPTFTHDRRDSFTKPKKGTFLGMSVDLSKSIGSSVDIMSSFKWRLNLFSPAIFYYCRHIGLYPPLWRYFIFLQTVFLSGWNQKCACQENLLVSDSRVAGWLFCFSGSANTLVLNFELAGL